MGPLETRTAPLTTVLRQVAIDIAEAQQALDLEAERQTNQALDRESEIAPAAFYFPELELNLSLAFSVSRSETQTALNIAPANPSTSTFFQSASFSSSLRAKIAPRNL